MRRLNLIQAYPGEPTSSLDGPDAMGVGNELVEYDVRGGKLQVVVPANTPDEDVLEEPWLTRIVCIELKLDTGRTVRFSIPRFTRDAVMVELSSGLIIEEEE
jgi:hypothetical protein